LPALVDPGRRGRVRRALLSLVQGRAAPLLGHRREREIRTGAGAARLIWPRRGRCRRGRCRSCGATHVLLSSWAAPRRAGSIRLTAWAAAAPVLHGTGTARPGAQLGVPAATVRGRLRRLRYRAGQLL
jgi:hypothetical protein